MNDNALILYCLFCRITNALDLKEHLQKTVKKLPAGIKRKVLSLNNKYVYVLLIV